MRSPARPFYAIRFTIFLPILAGLICGIGACSEDEGGINRLVVKGRFTPESLDFGEVTIGETKALPAVLKNTGSLAYTIEKIDVPQSFSIGGKTSLTGTVIAASEEITLDVIFLAAEEGEKTGTLQIYAEGAQDPTKLELHGIAVVRRVPRLAVAPVKVDFGTVELNTEARQMVTLSNTGNAPSTIDGAALASTNALLTGNEEFGLGGGVPLTVDPDGSGMLEVVFRPKTEGQKSDRIRFTATGGGPPVDLEVTGNGQAPRGTLICQPSTVDFGQVERGQSASQQVTCQARGGEVSLSSASLPSTGNPPIFALAAPVTAMVLADLGSSVITVQFNAEGLPMRHQEMLTVSFTGAMGPSTVQVPIRGEVIPPPATETAISLFLRWNTNLTDVDLHLVRPGGRPFGRLDGSDCYFAEMSPDWNTIGDMTDNPFLDKDDTDGMGPENINLSRTAPGRYEVWVHYFADRGLGRSRATVEVHLAGMNAGSFSRDLSCNDLWKVGDIQWNGMTGTFAPSSQVQPTAEGFCGNR